MEKNMERKNEKNCSLTYSHVADYSIKIRDAFSPTALVQLEQNNIIYGPGNSGITRHTLYIGK